VFERERVVEIKTALRPIVSLRDVERASERERERERERTGREKLAETEPWRKAAVRLGRYVETGGEGSEGAQGRESERERER